MLGEPSISRRGNASFHLASSGSAHLFRGFFFVVELSPLEEAPGLKMSVLSFGLCMKLF